MTDYTNYERNMSRHEMALRLNIETAIRKCCESECAELKKKLEDIKKAGIEAELKIANYRTLLKGANANASTLSLENEKLKKELEDIKTAFEIKRDNLNGLGEEIVKLRQAYDCSREKFVTEFNNVTYNYECAIKENERLREKVANQKTQLNGVQQALGDRNTKIEALNYEVDRLKKEVKETRVVFEPTSYLIDIQAKDEEIKTLRKKNLDLKNENEGWKLKHDQIFLNKNRETTALKDEIEALKDALHDNEVEIHKLKEERDGYCWYFDSCEKTVTELRTKVKCLPTTQPLYIENLNVTYYANGPVWTNEDNEDVEQTA